VLGSALLSVCGAWVIIISALRLKELSKRFFAIRLIFFLALTDCLAAAFNILGACADIQQLLYPASSLPLLCDLQALGLLYFNLASILWTSCFAFALYRDVVPSYRRQALRKYEVYFHGLCWPVPAILTTGCFHFGYLREAGDGKGWCALGLGYSRQHLACFYGPLLAAFTFNLITYTAVLSHSREKRVSRITSLYLLGFTIVWLPSLVSRLQVVVSPTKTPAFVPSALEALCMPLQGALNALVYGWSMPSIRDVYRSMLLGTDGLDTLQVSPSESSLVSRSPSYSPPDLAANLPAVQHSSFPPRADLIDSLHNALRDSEPPADVDVAAVDIYGSGTCGSGNDCRNGGCTCSNGACGSSACGSSAYGRAVRGNNACAHTPCDDGTWSCSARSCSSACDSAGGSIR